MKYILILIFFCFSITSNTQIISPTFHGFLNKSITAPVFFNKGVNSFVTSGTANYQIKILNKGGNTFSSSGICISTSPSPDISNRVINSNIINNIISCDINSLTPGTKYYVRAFLTTAKFGTIYSNEEFFYADFYIGRNYLNGKIAYIFSPSDEGYIEGEVHGIIAANADIDNRYVMMWGGVRYSLTVGGGCCNVDYITTGTTATKIGAGLTNTQRIKQIMDSSSWQFNAVRLAYSSFLEDGVTKYWFLPSLDELYILYLNKDEIGGFYTDAQKATGYENRYYTSTEIDEAYVEVINFDNGTRDKNSGYKGAGGYGWIRQIRYF
jgi:hypothetical protein